MSEWTTGRRPRRDPTKLHELKPQPRSDGRLHISLGRSSGLLLVHRLVASAYLGPCPDGQEVRHLDGVCTHNHHSNLEYGTRLENVEDSIRLGVILSGERHYMAKLTDADVRAIRLARDSGESLLSIAGRFGITIATVCDIAKRRTWRHVA